MEINDVRELKILMKETSRIVKSINKLDEPKRKDAVAVIQSAQKSEYRSLDSNISLFSVLYILQPSALAGGRMKNHLRSLIAKHMKLHPASVSKKTKDLLFFYDTYRGFRENADNLIGQILREIKN